MALDDTINDTEPIPAHSEQLAGGVVSHVHVDSTPTEWVGSRRTSIYRTRAAGEASSLVARSPMISVILLRIWKCILVRPFRELHAMKAGDLSHVAVLGDTPFADPDTTVRAGNMSNELEWIHCSPPPLCAVPRMMTDHRESCRNEAHGTTERCSSFDPALAVPEAPHSNTAAHESTFSHQCVRMSAQPGTITRDSQTNWPNN